MTTIVLITHNNIGKEILKTAEQIIGENPCNTEVINISHNISFDKQLQFTQKTIKQIKKSEDILILTDIKGASPYNIAIKACPENGLVVCNLELGMMISILNYCQLPIVKILGKLSLKTEKNDNNRYQNY